jgi:hypothetical protein
VQPLLAALARHAPEQLQAQLAGALPAAADMSLGKDAVLAGAVLAGLGLQAPGATVQRVDLASDGADSEAAAGGQLGRDPLSSQAKRAAAALQQAAASGGQGEQAAAAQAALQAAADATAPPSKAQAERAAAALQQAAASGGQGVQAAAAQVALQGAVGGGGGCDDACVGAAEARQALLELAEALQVRGQRMPDLGACHGHAVP